MLINLLPPAEKEYLRGKRRTEMYFLCGIVFSSIIIFGALMSLPALIELRVGVISPGKVVTLGPVDTNVSSTTVTYESLIEEVKKANNEINLVKSSDQNSTNSRPSQIFSRLINSLAKARTAAAGKLTINNWQITKVEGDGKSVPTHYSVGLQGTAENRYVLRALQNEFNKTEGVLAVEAPVSNYVPGKNISFTMKVTIK